MKNLEQTQRKQTTTYVGRLEEVEVELLGNQGTRRVVLGNSKRERENVDSQFDLVKRCLIFSD